MKAVRIEYTTYEGVKHFSGLVKKTDAQKQLKAYSESFSSCKIVDFDEEY